MGGRTEQGRQGTGRSQGVLQWLPVGISAAALSVSAFSAGTAFAQSRLEAVFQPLQFQISRGAQSVAYQIASSDGAARCEIPGYEIDFSCRTGAYREFAQIYYDRTALEMAFADLDVLESGDYTIRSTGQLPGAAYAPGETVYDYCFVHTVSAAGQKELWLLYYELDPAAGTVRGPFRASDTILLSQAPEGSSREKMLEDYRTLYDRVNALPGR